MHSDQDTKLKSMGMEGDGAVQEDHLPGLGQRMERAMELRRDGKDDQALEMLRAILKEDPRLPEPRLELAHLAAGKEDWTEAEGQARLAVETLRSGGQWTLDLSEDELLSFALNLLGEILIRSIEDSELIFKDKPRFTEVWNEASHLFKEALELNGGNADARSNVTHHRPMVVPES